MFHHEDIENSDDEDTNDDDEDNDNDDDDNDCEDDTEDGIITINDIEPSMKKMI